MHRNTMKMIQNMSLVPMGWIECILCKKYRCDFRAQTCALIAPVQPVLHWVSCNNEILTNAPKHYENAPKHEFRVKWGGSRVFVAKKLPCNLVVRTLHYLHQFSLFRIDFHSVTKQSKMHPTLQNTPIHQFSVQWGVSGAFVAKNSNAISWHELVN
jgi:hypothetical protein